MAWCRLAGAAPLPAAPATVADYLMTPGERLSAGALARRAAAIAAQHRSHGLTSPASDPAVTTLLRQARRNATRRRAPPPAATRLTRMATACPGDLAGLRDRALLLLAATGLGRSALVGLDVEQVHFLEAGVDLVLQSQLRAERTVTVRRVASLGACPVRALKDWIDASDSRFGPVFRKVDPSDLDAPRSETPSPRNRRMTRAAVNAAATADALLAWLATQARGGATAAPAKSKGCPEEAASAQDPDCGPGVPDARTLDVPATAPAVGQDTGVTQPVVRAEAAHQTVPMRLTHPDWLHHSLAIIGAADQLAAFQRAAAGAGIIPWQIDLDRMEEDVFHLLVAKSPDKAGG